MDFSSSIAKSRAVTCTREDMNGLVLSIFPIKPAGCKHFTLVCVSRPNGEVLRDGKDVIVVTDRTTKEPRKYAIIDGYAHFVCGAKMAMVLDYRVEQVEEDAVEPAKKKAKQ